MPWFRVDDGMPFNKKVVPIPRRRRKNALGLWMMCGCWSSFNHTDGLIPLHVIDEMGGTKREIDDLVDLAGLWSRVDGGYLHLNWAEYQPTRENTEAKKAGHAEQMRAWREAKKTRRDKGVIHHAPTTHITRDTSRDESVTSSRSDVFPSRPVSIPKSIGGISRANAHPREDDGDQPSATEQVLTEFGSWLTDNGQPRPPSAVNRQLALSVHQMLSEGIPAADIMAGLQAWQSKGGTGPGALPGFVHEVRSTPTGKSRRRTDPDPFEHLLAEADQLDQKGLTR